MMPKAVRFLAIPCILLPLFLVGAPAFPALGRAVSQAFQVTATVVTAPAPGVPQRSEQFGGEEPADTAPVVTPANRSRGALLPLYVSFTALQILDAHTTLTAIDRGAAEANPLMRGIVGSPAALLAVKAGTAAGAIYLAERLRVHSRVGAVLMMAGLNSLYAAVVANNYRVLRQGNR
jgi:hypothetical protein